MKVIYAFTLCAFYITFVTLSRDIGRNHSCGSFEKSDHVVIFVYHYHPVFDSIGIVFDTKTINLLFFIQHDILSDRNTQYVILIIGSFPKEVRELLLTLTSKFSNINIMLIPSEKATSDACALHLAFRKCNVLLKYEYITILNDTARGPFRLNWKSMFRSYLNEDVKQVGSYLNCQPVPHIQSFAFMMKMSDFMLYSLSETTCELGKKELIIRYEVGASQRILKSGKSIMGLFPPYSDRFNSTTSVNKCRFQQNPTVDGYFGLKPLPHEIVFLKVAGTGIVSSPSVDVLTARHLDCFNLHADSNPTEVLKNIKSCLYTSIMKKVQQLTNELKNTGKRPLWPALERFGVGYGL